MWSLFEDEKELKPLVFSNGKTQADVVKEVIDAIKQGNKIIFIRGKCGSGKSALALNLARKLGKTSIVVPIKSLQEQYINDYFEKKYLLKNEKEKLKISSIVGRQNFKCRFIEEGKLPLPSSETKEKNANLFESINPVQKIEKENPKNKSCDNNYLPCKIDIKEKNSALLKEYLKQNPDVNVGDFDSVYEIKRMTIAPVCPYYSPIISDEFEIFKFKDYKKIKYNGLRNKKFTIYQRNQGCPYYEQYLSYADSDVIIFNSLKYKLETLMDRKPETELEIIDECDEFLDSLANEEQINLNKLSFSLNPIFPNNKIKEITETILDIINAIKIRYKDSKSDDIFELKNTLVEDLLKEILENSELIDSTELDEHSYLYHLDEVARMFADFFDEAFFSIQKDEKNIIINLVTINLEKRFNELLNKNKIFIMMSGTIHSENVLRKIFGIQNFKIIEAETKHQGDLINCRYGHEIDCSYDSFKKNYVTREQYLKALSKSISCAKPPVLVHVTAFSDLPTEREKEEYKLDNLISKEQLIQEQGEDPLSKRVNDFKNKKTDILFTTRCTRGMDFPGDMCNSIIITRFPYPNISGIFWKILKKTHPDNFMSFYMDKAHRELLQRIYRGLRSRNDKLYLLSPDIRVIEFKID